MLEALHKTDSAERFPIRPKLTRFGRPIGPLFVEGWEVNLGIGDNYVVLLDGALLETHYPHRPSSRYSGLHDWVDARLRPEATESSPVTLDTLRSHLPRAKESVVRILADVLHKRGVSM